MKRATASYWASVTRSGRCLGSGSESGGTANSRSAWRCSSTWLVTSKLSRGHAASRSLSGTAASLTCSKLSSSTSMCLSFKAALSRLRGACPLCSLMSKVCRMAGRTCSASLTGASATRNTPSAYCSVSSVATCKARRVLPMPPGPVSVTSRTWLSRKSRRRPRSPAGGQSRA